MVLEYIKPTPRGAKTLEAFGVVGKWEGGVMIRVLRRT